MLVLLAREAESAVILRRGPTEWWRVTLWDTRRDKFEHGQWFRGRIYPGKCDVSPDGSLLLYFAGKFNRRSADRGYGDTWTAVSRPPYLTALALWPIGGTYGGGGVFLDNRTIAIGGDLPHHRDHPPGPLRLASPAVWPPSSVDHGWTSVGAARSSPGYSKFTKRCGDLLLGRDLREAYPSRSPTLYTLSRADGEPIALFEAHWADWDQRCRLVAAVGGRVLTGRLTRKKTLVWRELISTHEDHPVRVEAPPWAQRW
jgi:hypothetical protein